MEKSKIMRTYSCLSGDTVVRTDKGNFKISDIEGESVNVFEQNKWYMIDKSKEASDVLCTKDTDKFVRIELEDGTIVKVTPEHRLRLNNGEYKEAQYLTDEDVLMEEINIDNIFDINIWKQFNLVSEDSLKDYFVFVLKCVAEDSNADNVQEHHVLPKSLMCNNVIVRISARNHFLCHKMLAENMFSGEFGKKLSIEFESLCCAEKLEDSSNLINKNFEKLDTIKVNIVKNGTIINGIKIEDLDMYIKDGWKLYSENAGDESKEIFVMNRNGIIRFVSAEEAELLKNDGYVFGTGISLDI